MMPFVQSGGLRIVAEWLSPLPDQSLPHIKLREALLKWLMMVRLYSDNALFLGGGGGV